MFKKIIFAVFVSGLGFAALPSIALAAKPEIYSAPFSKSALEGYDTVAYFTTGRPIKGSDKYVTTYKGFEFRFASAQNLVKFKSDPDAYRPQYGGYCAWAAAQGYTAKGNPLNWRIVDGNLYLNYDATIQKRWEQDIPGFITKADRNWPAILNK
jgi:YHS domain-containing protein